MTDVRPSVAQGDQADAGELLRAVTDLLFGTVGTPARGVAPAWGAVVTALARTFPLAAVAITSHGGGHASIDCWAVTGHNTDAVVQRAHERLVRLSPHGAPEITRATGLLSIFNPTHSSTLCVTELAMALADAAPSGWMDLELSRPLQPVELATLATVARLCAASLALSASTVAGRGSPTLTGIPWHALVSLVAHDLRNPLAAITMSAAVLSRRAGAGDGARQLAVIRRSTDGLTRMVQNLVDAARIAAGTLRVEPKPQPLADLLCDAVRTLDPALKHRKVSVDLPLLSPLLGVMVDRERVVQALANVLFIGVAMARDDGNLRLIANADTDTAVVEVRSTRLDLPAEELRQWMDGEAWPFRTGRAGVGLGLYVARDVFAAHHGSLTLTALPEDGFVATMALPRAML